MPFQKQNLSGFSNSQLKCICSQQLILNSRLCCCQASNQQGICSPIFQHILKIKTRLESLSDYVHNEWKIFKKMVDNFIFARWLPDNCLMSVWWLPNNSLMILNSSLCCYQASNQQGICSSILQHILQISSIFAKCPDRVITSITTKPYIPQKTLFHWMCSKFIKG